MSKCNKCNGTLFVCENHPDQEAFECKHCKGAGMPCECTKMSEPVTWATENLQDVMSPRYRQMHMDDKSSTWKQFPIPLYTHPMRELSDKEIFDVAIDTNIGGSDQSVLDFARALLKKASEK